MSGTCSLLEILFRKKVSYSRTVLLHADSTCQIFVWALQSWRITLTSLTLKMFSPRHSFTSTEARTSICFLFRCTAKNSCCKGAQSVNRNTDAMMDWFAVQRTFKVWQQRFTLPCSDPIRSVSTTNKEAPGTKTRNWCSFLTFLVPEFSVFTDYRCETSAAQWSEQAKLGPTKSGGLAPEQFFYALDFGANGRKASKRQNRQRDKMSRGGILAEEESRCFLDIWFFIFMKSQKKSHL